MHPIPLPEQDWLYLGRPMRRIVCGLDAKPTALVVPDPRWFALHKRWLSDKPERDPLKKPKDRRQAESVWAAVKRGMPHYPIDENFKTEVPEILQPVMAQLEY